MNKLLIKERVSRIKIRFPALLFLISALLFFAPEAYSQKDGSAKQKVKKAEAKKADQVKNSQNAQVKGKKRHLAIQDKKTRKRMKKDQKRHTHLDSFDRRTNAHQKLYRRKKPKGVY